jgi:hypothetical protein
MWEEYAVPQYIKKILKFKKNSKYRVKILCCNIEKIFCSKIKIIFAFLSNKKSSFVDDPSSDNHVEGAKVKKAPNMRKYKWCTSFESLQGIPNSSD